MNALPNATGLSVDYKADLAVVEEVMVLCGFIPGKHLLEFFEWVHEQNESSPDGRWAWTREYIADQEKRPVFILAQSRVLAGFRALFAPAGA